MAVFERVFVLNDYVAKKFQEASYEEKALWAVKLRETLRVMEENQRYQKSLLLGEYNDAEQSYQKVKQGGFSLFLDLFILK